MFSSAGFQLTSGQTVPDSLVDILVISGNEDTARFTKLLTRGLDELIVSLVPIKDDVNEMRQLMHTVGQL